MRAARLDSRGGRTYGRHEGERHAGGGLHDERREWETRSWAWRRGRLLGGGMEAVDGKRSGSEAVGQGREFESDVSQSRGRG